MPGLFVEVISVPEPGDRSFLKKRLALDARIKRAASGRGYDSIVIMHPTTFGVFKKTGRIPRSLELNILNLHNRQSPLRALRSPAKVD